MDNTDLYRAARHRMIDLARDADGRSPVAACPSWDVHDLMAHLAGGATDLVEGRLEGVGTDAWTAAQVAARADRSLAEVVGEWEEVGPRLEEALTSLGGAPGQLVFDTVTHEHDLRHALDAQGERDPEGLAVALRWVAKAWRRAAPAGSGTLRLVAGDQTIDLGEGEPDAIVTLTPFEALRALTGRRSPDQLRAYEATAPIDPWLASFTWGPFAVRDEALDER
jgi:uncharacterized protein (TIGR03083 family)